MLSLFCFVNRDRGGKGFLRYSSLRVEGEMQESVSSVAVYLKTSMPICLGLCFSVHDMRSKLLDLFFFLNSIT